MLFNLPEISSFSGIDSGGGNTRGMPLIPEGRAGGPAVAAGFRLGGRERRDLMPSPLKYKSRWTGRERDTTAEFTRHHVSGKDTAVLMPLPLPLSLAHAQMIIGDELAIASRSESGVKRGRGGEMGGYRYQSVRF